MGLSIREDAAVVAVEEDVMMFTRSLERDQHTRRYTIRAHRDQGWEVLAEQDGQVTSETRYHDWHRVERARQLVDREIARLQDGGWKERN